MSKLSFDIGLVKFECGCIGFPGSDGKAMVLNDCRSGRDGESGYGFWVQDHMTKPGGRDDSGDVIWVPKEYKPLAPDKQGEILEALNKLLTMAKPFGN